MLFVKAIVTLDESDAGIKVSGIEAYERKNVRHDLPSTQFMDDLNQLSGLTKDKVRMIVARQFHLPPESVEFR